MLNSGRHGNNEQETTNFNGWNKSLMGKEEKY